MADKSIRPGMDYNLRNGGGAHEWFPVSEAAKAKELGFTYSELGNLSSPRENVWFENIPDPKHPGSVLDGPHSTGGKLPPGQSGRASSAAHDMLIDTLKQTTSKTGSSIQ
ncbi:hypothetical protein ACK1MO_003613, partial [Salmonella enterica]